MGEGAELSSHAVDGPGDITNRAATSDQALPSHAVELEEVDSFALGGDLDSPKSSVGSARGHLGHPGIPNLDLAHLSTPSSRLLSQVQALAQTPEAGSPSHPASGRDTSGTPLSSHAVPAASSESDAHADVGGTPLSSHAVDYSSSSGSGPDEAFAESPYL